MRPCRNRSAPSEPLSDCGQKHLGSSRPFEHDVPLPRLPYLSAYARSPTSCSSTPLEPFGLKGILVELAGIEPASRNTQPSLISTITDDFELLAPWQSCYLPCSRKQYRNCQCRAKASINPGFARDLSEGAAHSYPSRMGLTIPRSLRLSSGGRRSVLIHMPLRTPQGFEAWAISR